MLLLGAFVVGLLVPAGAPMWMVWVVAGAWIVLWATWTRLKIWAVRKTETQ